VSRQLLPSPYYPAKKEAHHKPEAQAKAACARASGLCPQALSEKMLKAEQARNSGKDCIHFIIFP
jgi:hypothetical protein